MVRQSFDWPAALVKFWRGNYSVEGKIEYILYLLEIMGETCLEMRHVVMFPFLSILLVGENVESTEDILMGYIVSVSVLL